MRKYKYILLFFLLSIVCFIVSCNTNSNKVTKGHYASFIFNTNPTTGYDWNYEFVYNDVSNPGLITEVSNEIITNTEDSQKTGTPSKRKFVFSGSQVGTVSVLFKYMRSWDESQMEWAVQYDLEIDEEQNIVCSNRIIEEKNAKPNNKDIPMPEFSDILE